MCSLPETYSDFFCEKNLDQIFRPLIKEGLFFYNVHGILCLKIIAVVNEGAIVTLLDIFMTLKGTPDFAAGPTRAFHSCARQLILATSRISSNFYRFEQRFAF